ncbi:hypothetical protein LZ32DRAFT_448693 [Colletotrichum eremochloae]|nr:hypothetical protein LZ32DRAFT_448693 [Colletotrichum eremochloae]
MIRGHGAIFFQSPPLSSGRHRVHYQQAIDRVESGSPAETSVPEGGGEMGRPFSADKSQFAIIGPHGRCLMGNPAPNYYVSGRVWADELLFGHLYAKPMHAGVTHAAIVEMPTNSSSSSRQFPPIAMQFESNPPALALLDQSRKSVGIGQGRRCCSVSEYNR